MIDVIVLFFLFGLAAGLLRSELKLPGALCESPSLILLLTIGLKGGEGLAQQALGPLVPQLGAVILLGVAQTRSPSPSCVAWGASGGRTPRRRRPTTAR